MMRTEVRIEILKLVHRHDHSPELILERARSLEAWATECEPSDDGNQLRERRRGRKTDDAVMTAGKDRTQP